MTVIEQHEHDLANMQDGDILPFPKCDNCGHFFSNRLIAGGEEVIDYITIGADDEYCVCGNCQQTLDMEANNLATERAGECPEDDESYWDEFYTECLPQAEEDVKAEMVESIKRRLT